MAVIGIVRVLTTEDPEVLSAHGRRIEGVPWRWQPWAAGPRVEGGQVVEAFEVGR